jgi:pyruvate dehydrogenase E1 component alpha subunit
VNRPGHAGAVTGILIATGAGFSSQVLGLDRVALAFFGDGAINEGSFHEGLNLAALWRLPVVYLCENNGYAELTPASVHSAGPGLAARGAAYGIAVEEVDGTDALAVREVVAGAVERSRRDEGPVLVEARTHRWHGHFEGDQQRYRSREELFNPELERDYFPSAERIVEVCREVVEQSR